MPIRFLALCAACCLTAAAAMAVPAKRMMQRIRLTDGREITATLCGDERVSYYETACGALYFKQADGLCRPTSNLEIQLRFNDRLTSERVREQMFAASNPRAVAARRRAPRRGLNPVGEYIGSKKGLVILVEFKDKTFADANPQPFYERMFNEAGFAEDGQTGSVHDYFHDQSYGKFDLTFDVVGPVTASQSMKYYGAIQGEAHDNYGNIAGLVSEVCRAVNGQVNFKDYDWNGDGYADQVYIIYAGYGQATGGGDDTIWPHASYVPNGPTLDNTRIGTYACNNELNGGEGSRERMGIGTAIHEFSHCLGLPDFYNTTQGSGGGPANWDIMSGGSYNGNGRCPVGYSSYERWVCGWLTPTVLDEPTTVSDMPALEDEPVAYMLTHDTNENEYFLLENRQPVKWDRETGGKGMLIYHVDYDEHAWAYNSPNNDPEHERMALIAADADATSRPEGDPFPGANGLRKRFTDTSLPGAKLYNPMPDGTKKLGKPIENITLSAQGKIGFTALNGVLPRTQITNVSEITDSGFTVAWETVEGAESYKVALRRERAAYETPEEGEVLVEGFEGCVTKTVGFNNIGTTMDKYTSTKGWSGTNLYTSPDGLQMSRGAKLGTLETPTLPETVNGRISILFKVKPGKGNAAAQGTMIIHTSMGDLTANFAANGWVHIATGEGQMPDGEYTIEIRAGNVMNLQKFVVLDGVYEGEIFDDYYNKLTPTAPTEVTSIATLPRRAAESTPAQVSTTEETSIAFTGLSSKYTYYVSVTALGASGKGPWSEETAVKLNSNTTAVQGIKAEANTPGGAWFTLQGHRLSEKSGRPGIYIRNGRKIMVK